MITIVAKDVIEHIVEKYHENECPDQLDLDDPHGKFSAFHFTDLGKKYELHMDVRFVHNSFIEKETRPERRGGTITVERLVNAYVYDYTLYRSDGILIPEQDWQIDTATIDREIFERLNSI